MFWQLCHGPAIKAMFAGLFFSQIAPVWHLWVFAMVGLLPLLVLVHHGHHGPFSTVPLQ